MYDGEYVDSVAVIENSTNVIEFVPATGATY